MTTVIRTIGDPTLRTMSRQVDELSDDVKKVIEELTSTAQSNPHCAGLAAPQIGHSVAVFVAYLGGGSSHKGDLMVFINPTITTFSTDCWTKEEGCLSIPNFFAPVSRPSTIDISYRDSSWTLHTSTYSGWDARVIQHEYDHLHGILFVDKLSPSYQKAFRQFRNKQQ